MIVALNENKSEPGNTVTRVRCRFRALTALAVVGIAMLGTVRLEAGPAQASVGSASASVGSASASGAGRTAAAPAAVPGPVVLLGTGGVGWSDVGPDEPVLTGLLRQDASGWLADRSVRALTCPVDGWLAVSAGKRAADRPTGSGQPACREPRIALTTPGGRANIPDWPAYLREAAADSYEANPGLLGDTLTGAGRSVAAVGPGAAIAVADARGQVARAWSGGTGTSGGTGGDVNATALAADVKSALATDPDLLVVDLGGVRDPGRTGAGGPGLTIAFAESKAQQVRALDARLGLVLAQLPASATVIVASTADAGAPSELQLLAARGPAPLGGEYRQSLLGSTSTRQDAIAQTTDLLPTVLRALGLPVPDEAVGSPLRPVQAGRSLAHRRSKLLDVGEAAASIHSIVPWFFGGLEVAQIILYGVATLTLRRLSKSVDPGAAVDRLRTLRWLRWGSLIFAAVPAATFLANLLPWWRSSLPGLAITLATVLFVIPITGLALLGPWRRALLGPFGVIAAVTALVLAADVTTGSHLVLSSLLGMSPVVAGRFYGFGNTVFAVFVTGALLSAIALADWQVRLGRARRAALIVGLVGIAATAVDGTPGFGSDFGGPPAIIPAFAVLALLVMGVSVTWRRITLIFGATVTVIVALSVLDWARGPGNRTHLGRFVQTLIDGKAWPVLERKAQGNLGILFTSWWTLLLPLAAAFVVLVLARPVAVGVRPLQLAYDRSPVLRSGVIAFGILMVIGVLMNDSGIFIVAIAATVAIPLLITASVRALELQDGESAGNAESIGAPLTPSAPTQ